MMLYKVVRQLIEVNDKSWQIYLESSGLNQITDFCSLDSGINKFDNNEINHLGLINKIDKSFQLRNKLRDSIINNSHAEKCEVWAIYRIDT